MKVTVIPIVIGTLGTIPKVLVKMLEEIEIREQTETILSTTLLRSARILRRDLKTWGDSDSKVSSSANAGLKILQGVI